MKQEQKIYSIIFIIVILILLGFYFLFDKINKLNNELSLLKNITPTTSSMPTITSNSSTTNTTNNSTSSTNNQTTTSSQQILIPTAIVFNATSSPDLQPQTQLMITIDNVIKNQDKLIVNFKIFSNQTQTYSAINPKQIIQIFNSSGDNTTADIVNGDFSSIPPQSSVKGSLMFSIDSTIQKIILQFGNNDNLEFYEFDFQQQTYKSVQVG
ncbi:MAG: hypothetical protein ACP5IC_01745 [Minisyncoccia bacterium]